MGVVEWLVNDSKSTATSKAFIERLCEQMDSRGAPVWRIIIGHPTLHPEISAVSYLWERGQTAKERRVGHGMRERGDYLGSPIEYIHTHKTRYRRDLKVLDSQKDHRLLHRLAAQGGTDYLGLPVLFTNDVMGVATIATDRVGGFCDADIDALDAIMTVATPVIELHALRFLSISMLDIYVGHRTGARILNGQIGRNDAEMIEAAIWFSDLRDFTPLTEQLPLPKLLDSLNAYFDLVAAAVAAHGGEILKFIGDAMMIVFPVTGKKDATAVCTAAYDAAVDAFASLDAFNHRRRRAKVPELNFGVGLHFGEVIYGNVGAAERLDFTVIGAAVNHTARLESLTKTVGSPMLMSRPFTDCITRDFEFVGVFPMKGIAEPQEAFTAPSL